LKTDFGKLLYFLSHQSGDTQLISFLKKDKYPRLNDGLEFASEMPEKFGFFRNAITFYLFFSL